jgi:protein-L-isoaspartate(D-aspartate) O-methyltransferase
MKCHKKLPKMMKFNSTTSLKIKFLFLCLMSFPISFVFCSTSEQVLEDRIAKQNRFPRLGGWCLVPWKNQIFCGEILDIQGSKVTVKIIDTDISFSEWPLCIFNIDDLQQNTHEKYFDLEGLINGLKKNNRLKTVAIEMAMRSIDRSWFCPEHPYYDTAIDIGHEMYISAPHMHILSLELCKDLLSNATSILDVGSGSGYLTALFSKLSPHAQITGIEYFEDLISESEKKIAKHLPLELSSRIKFVSGDGRKGVLENAPYTIIYVGFMCHEIPQELVNQLAPGGRMIIPVGNKKSSYNQKCLSGKLMVLEKALDGSFQTHEIFSCSFVPSMQPK